jgi:hypothetical protein
LQPNEAFCISIRFALVLGLGGDLILLKKKVTNQYKQPKEKQSLLLE